MPYLDYLKSIQEKRQTQQAGEHTYRGIFEKFLESYFPKTAKTQYSIINEPKRIACGAPDFSISQTIGGDTIAIGYIEAKDIGVNLNDAEKSDQLVRYKDALENLILTDYLEFRFFSEGKKIATIHIAENNNGIISPITENFLTLQNLLKEFFANRRMTIDSAEDLARIMANKTKLMKEIFLNALSNSSKDSILLAQYKAFEKMLINDLSHTQFADIYAQTITYGLFTAKIQHYKTNMDSVFLKENATQFIPASNPFLQKLFHHISGSHLPEESLDDATLWIIDNLCDVFRFVNWQAILKTFDYSKDADPVIHFYENFLQAYDAKLKKARGVWYTPQPVVQFIVKAVDDCLKQHFKLTDGLANISTVDIAVNPQSSDGSKTDNAEKTQTVHKVQLLDVATGTGTFIAQTIQKIYQDKFQNQQAMWSDYVEQHLLPRLHGFEILMASYAICHLKIHLLLEQLGYRINKDTPHRLGVYLTNTLEAEHPVADLPFTRWLAIEANQASRIKNEMPVMVAFGNPPYSGESQNKNDFIAKLMENYKQEPSGGKLKERNPKWLNDDYVKFMRMGEHYIDKNGEGILAYITNHSYIDNPTFRGMRFHLLKTFDVIYIIDLHGNAKKQEKAPDGKPDKNVFDIEQGAAIIIAIKKRTSNKKLAKIFHCDLRGSNRQDKFAWLKTHHLKNIDFTEITHHAPYYFFCPKDFSAAGEYEKGMKINALFTSNSVGIVTARDKLTIHENIASLKQTVATFVNLSDEKAREQFKLGDDTRDWKVSYARSDLNNLDLDKTQAVKINYRPFDTRFTYYTGKSKGFYSFARKEVMQHMLAGDNVGLVFKRGNPEEKTVSIHVTNDIIDFRSWSRPGMQGGDYLAPLYIYDTDSLNFGEPTRTPNLDMSIVNKIADTLSLTFILDHDNAKHDKRSFTPLDLLDYIYAILHSPTYRETYKEFLKIDFPCVPYPNDATLFWQLVALGGQIRKLHLLTHPVLDTSITKWEIEGSNIVNKPEYKKDRIYINATQYFDDAPEIAWDFYIGGYQPAQKWLKDRKDKKLDYDDLNHYQKIITALAETHRLMQEIDSLTYKLYGLTVE